MSPLRWGCREAARGIYFSSHEERKDCRTENPLAVTEVSGVLVGSADA